MTLAPAIQEFPAELQMSMLRFAEAVQQDLRAEFGVRREDFLYDFHVSSNPRVRNGWRCELTVWKTRL